MHIIQRNPTRELLLELQRRVPASRQFVEEAFTSEHRRPIMVKLNDLRENTFYLFDDITACAFSDAVVEWGVRQGSGRLTLSYSAFGEFQAQQHRLQRVVGKLDRICVLSIGQPLKSPPYGSGFEFCNIMGNPLTQYRIAMMEGRFSALFICREDGLRSTDKQRNLGFFTCDKDTVEEFADGIAMVVRGLAKRLTTFERLELLHQTTQRIARELESYSRRMELVACRAQRRPDLLTPARFNRIVGQAIVKMEQLKEIPRRALRSINRTSS
ncbi:MAG: hypothetical protein ABSA97_04235 [Verrucomicrobiia bacterium]